MAEMNPDQALTALKGLPEDKQRAILTRLSPEARKGILGKLHSGHSEDITTNTIDPKTGKGYGLYEFQDANGEKKQIPYNKVPDAIKLGYKTTQETRERYAKDKDFAELKELQAHPRVAPHATLHFEPAKDQKTPEQRMEEAAAPPQNRTDLPEAFDRQDIKFVPETWDQIRKAVTSITEQKDKEYLTNFVKRVGQGLFGMADFPITAMGGLVDAMSDDPDVSAQGIHTLGTLIPPEQALRRIQEFKEDWKKNKTQAIDNVLADVVTMKAAHRIGKATEKATDVAAEFAANPKENIKRVAKGFVRDVTGVRPSIMQDMVDNIIKENDAKREKYEGLKKQAEFDHQGAMINYEAEKKFKEQQAEHEHQGEMIDYKVKNDAKLRDAVDDHTQKVKEVTQKRDKIMRDWKEKADAIAEDNKAAEQALELRRQTEAELKEKTDKYFADENTKRMQAKHEENQAWKPWHEKVKDFEVDAAPLKEELDKLEQSNPEVRRAMKQLIPSPDEVDEQSPYAQDRAAIMKSQGMTGSYWDLPSGKRAVIDSITQSSGLAPEPIDLNPDESGKIPLEKIHRAKSILGLKLAKGDFEGMVKGEMQQVYKALQRAEFEGSKTAGALDEQVKAAQATKKYHDNFGRVRAERKTKMTERMRQANPEEFRARQEEKALAGPQANYPELADQFKEIKALRDKLKDMPSEDQLRKSLKQLPEPPSAEDLPKYPEWKPPVYDRPPLKKEVYLGRPPLKNEPVPPEYKKIGWDQLSEANKKAYSKFIEQMRSRGVYVVAALPAIKIGTALMRFRLLDAAKDLIYTAAGAPFAVAGLNRIADFLDRPAVRDWVTNPTQEDMVKLNKYLPDHMRTQVAQALQKVAIAAKKKGIPVSPLLTAYISQYRPKQKKDEDIDKELEELTK